MALHTYHTHLGKWAKKKIVCSCLINAQLWSRSIWSITQDPTLAGEDSQPSSDGKMACTEVAFWDGWKEGKYIDAAYTYEFSEWLVHVWGSVHTVLSVSPENSKDTIIHPAPLPHLFTSGVQILVIISLASDVALIRSYTKIQQALSSAWQAQRTSPRVGGSDLCVCWEVPLGFAKPSHFSVQFRAICKTGRQHEEPDLKVTWTEGARK